MSTTGRGGLKAAFAQFRRPEDEEAERKLLGRSAEGSSVDTSLPDSQQSATQVVSGSYQLATLPISGGLVPRPLTTREPVRQLSFRCPQSLAGDLRRKAAFNQLEQQEILIEGLKRVLAELPDPPKNWDLI